MNNKYFDLLDNTTDWFWEVNTIGKFTYSNKVVEQFLGYSVQEILLMSPFDLMDSKTCEELSILFNQNLINQTKVYNLNYSAIKKDGTYIFLELNALPIYDKENILKGFRGISRDITQRVKEDLKNKYNFLSKILNHIPIPVFYKDKNGLYLGVNKSWEEITGLKEENVINKTVFDIAPKEIADVYYKEDQKVFRDEENPQVYEAELYNKTSDKKYKVIFNKSLFYDEKGEVAGLIGTIIDVSEITKLEKEKIENERIMIQQSKLSSMGEMIENIAHQWRQPLSTISTASTGTKLQKELNCLSDEQLISSLEVINNSAQYLSKTIDDFRNFFNSNNSKESEFDILDTYDKTLKLIEAQFVAKDIQIIKNINSYKLFSVENELIQVLINIFNNAKDIFITIHDTKRLIFIDTYEKNNNLCIEIKDSAGGVKEEIMDRIFEPYFTTKHKAKGTGIGFYMSQEIICKHLNGSLSVSNEEYSYEGSRYRGANFIIKIPK